MSQFEIKPATRKGVIPLIVKYAESGCGKTYSAILLARGIVGPKGKIAVIDSESGRASLYADIREFGGYDVIALESPFSPARYVEAHQFAVDSGADIIVIDSGSHEWEGIGGVLDMAATNEGNSSKGLHNWKGPKFEHAKFVAALIRSPVPVIVCLRAKFKTRQTKGTKEMAECGAIRTKDIGQTIILKDNNTSPIQADDFIFEATVHGEIMPDHSFRITKWSHPDLKKCFPENAPIELKHGEAVSKWCKAGGTPSKPDAKPEVQQSPQVASGSVTDLKKKLWTLTTSKHHGDKIALRQYLIDEMILDPDLTLEDLDALALEIVIKKVEEKLK